MKNCSNRTLDTGINWSVRPNPRTLGFEGTDVESRKASPPSS